MRYRCLTGGVMSDGLKAGKNAQWMLPLHRICSQCGQSASSISILRTRDGKSFRLYKCASCGGLAWVLGSSSRPHGHGAGKPLNFLRPLALVSDLSKPAASRRRIPNRPVASVVIPGVHRPGRPPRVAPA